MRIELEYNYHMETGTREWSDLTHSAGIIAGQLAQLHARLVGQVAEMLASQSWIGDGIRSPEHWLQVYTGISAAQANAVVRVAKRADELALTVAWMADGRISLDQADVIASRAPASSELEVLEIAEYLSVSQLRRTLSRYVFDETSVALPHEEEPLRPQPASLTMFTTHDGRFRLQFETDAVTGSVVESAIRETKDALFTAGQTEATLADGLVEVANRSLAAVESAGRGSRYRVLVHLSTDGHGWLGKRGALPQHLVEQFTCDGVIVPVWETDGSPVNVGRAQRIVPERTRRLVEDRDRGCRYPGCSVTGFLENHHIEHWSHGGRTDMDSLVSLCPFHHASHHRGDFRISGSAARGSTLEFHNRHGRPIRPVRVSPPPEPALKPPPWNLDRGLRVDPSNIDLNPHRVRFDPPERTTAP